VEWWKTRNEDGTTFLTGGLDAPEAAMSLGLTSTSQGGKPFSFHPTVVVTTRAIPILAGLAAPSREAHWTGGQPSAPGGRDWNLGERRAAVGGTGHGENYTKNGLGVLTISIQAETLLDGRFRQRAGEGNTGEAEGHAAIGNKRNRGKLLAKRVSSRGEIGDLSGRETWSRL